MSAKTVLVREFIVPRMPPKEKRTPEAMRRHAAKKPHPRDPNRPKGREMPAKGFADARKKLRAKYESGPLKIQSIAQSPDPQPRGSIALYLVAR